jgi:putative Mg2+ transporter-C (MgtC) family protein
MAVRSSTQNAESVARALQGLLAGIGFIGSGAIIRHRSRSHGSATAASIWTTAAIGVAVALDQFDIAIVLSVSTYTILRWLVPLRRRKETVAPPQEPDTRA